MDLRRKWEADLLPRSHCVQCISEVRAQGSAGLVLDRRLKLLPGPARNHPGWHLHLLVICRDSEQRVVEFPGKYGEDYGVHRRLAALCYCHLQRKGAAFEKLGPFR